MFEPVIHGIAFAGGVEVPPGRNVLPVKETVCERPGTLRRGVGRVLGYLAGRLRDASERMLAPAPRYRAHA